MCPRRVWWNLKESVLSSGTSTLIAEPPTLELVAGQAVERPDKPPASALPSVGS